MAEKSKMEKGDVEEKLGGSVIATVGELASGKTTVMGLLALTAIDKSIVEKEKFDMDIVEGETNVRNSVASLQHGHFPGGTPKGLWCEGCLKFRWMEKMLRIWKMGKEVSIPFVDISGEELEDMMKKWDAEDRGIFEEARNMMVWEVAKRARGLILVIPTHRLPVFQKELEQGREGLARYPDVNMARFLDSIFTFKKRYERSFGAEQCPPIKEVAFILSQVDRVWHQILPEGYNLTTEDGVDKFTQKYLPEVWNKLEFQGFTGTKVVKIASYVQLKRDKSGQLITEGGKPLIQVDRGAQRPLYSMNAYLKLINYFGKAF